MWSKKSKSSQKGFSSRSVRLTLFLTFALSALASPSLLSAEKVLTFTNGYDEMSASLCWIGQGSTVSQAVADAISGLEDVIANEISYRCARISGKWNASGIDIFLDGMHSNMAVIEREMIRKSRCVSQCDRYGGGCVVRYALKARDFEEILSMYIAKFGGGGIGAYAQRLESINRFFKGEYDYSEAVVVRVES